MEETTHIAEEEATPSGKEVVVEESTSGISEGRLIYKTVNDNGTIHAGFLSNGRVVRTFTNTDGMTLFL